MLKILSHLRNRHIYIITKSPPEPFSISKIKIKEISNEIKPPSQYENAITFFDDILGSSDSKHTE